MPEDQPRDEQRSPFARPPEAHPTGPAEARDAEKAEPAATTTPEPEAEPDQPADAGEENPRPQGAHSLWYALWHPGRGQFVIALVLALVSMGVVMQFKAKNADQSYSTARRADLIQMIDGLNAESRRLEAELAELETTRRRLRSGQDSDRIAQQEAARRLEVLSVLAGTAQAQGPGIRMIIHDPQRKVSPALLLDAVEEMRDADAEAIEFNDSARVVANTWFGGRPGDLLIDGKQIKTPLVIDVIGDPHALEEAARFRGGLASEVMAEAVGGSIEIRQQERVEITSLHAAPSQVFAKPVR